MKDGRIIALYIRESSEGQRGNWSHTRQKREALEFSQDQGEEGKVYEEIKSSKVGSTRPKWEQLKKDIIAGKVGILYFWKYERLGRDSEENEHIKKLLVEHHVQYYDGEAKAFLDLADYGVDLITTVKGKSSEIDNKRKAQYVRDALKEQYDAGQRRYTGRLYGYQADAKIVEKGGQTKIVRTWHVNEDEAKVIRFMYKLALEENLGLSAIARRLYAEHYFTREGKPWTHDRVRNILRNGIYAKLTTDSTGKEIESMAYPRIVEKKQYRLIMKRYPEHITAKKVGHPNEHLGSGLLECIECHSHFTFWPGYGEHKKKDGTVSRYDKHDYSHNARTGCAGQKYYDASVVDFLITKAFYDGVFHSREIVANLLKQNDVTELAEDVERLTKMIAQKKQAKDRLYRHIEHLDDATDVYPKINELDAEMKSIQKSIDEMNAKIEQASIEASNARAIFSTDYSAKFRAAEPKMQNMLVKTIIKKVIVNRHDFCFVYIDGTSVNLDYKAAQKALGRGKKISQTP